MMTRILILLCFLSSIAAAQSVGQYEIRKRGATGFTSYGITLSDGQVIGQTGGVPAALMPLITTNNLSDLTNAATARTNLGLGTAAIVNTSDDGDAGAVPIYTGSSELGAVNFYTFGQTGYLQAGSIKLTGSTSGVINLIVPAAAGSGSLRLPALAGTNDIITTGDTGTVTNAMLAGSIDLTSKVTGALPVANGGTGASTLTANNVILGNGTSAVQFVAPGTSGNVLTSNGTTWTSAAPAGGLTIGTTTITSGTNGRVLYNNAGVLGEMTTSGSGTQLALTNSPSFTTPTLGAATATTINGLTITSSTGTLTVNNGVTLTAATTGTVAILGANTFTAGQSISLATANTTAMQISGYSLTGSSTASMLNLAGTWNTTGAPSAIVLNVDNTASSASSKLLDIQLSSAPWFSLHRGTFGGTNLGGLGGIAFGDPNSGGNSFTLTPGRSDNVLYVGATQQFGLDFAIRNTGLRFRSAYVLSWSSDSTSYGTADVGVSRASSGVLKITDGASGLGSLTTGAITIGSSGSSISKVLTATASLDFGSIAAQTSADLTVTVTGAATGDAVVMGLPAAPESGVVFNAFVSSANTVTIRATNATSGAVDPASATFRATVIQH